MNTISFHAVFLLFMLSIIGCEKDNQRNTSLDEYVSIDGTTYNLNKFQYRFSEDTLVYRTYPEFSYDYNDYGYAYYGINGDNMNLDDGNHYDWDLELYFKSPDGSFGNTRNLIDFKDWDSNTELLSNTNCVIIFGFWSYTNRIMNTNSNLPGYVYYYSKNNGSCIIKDGYVYFSGSFYVIGEDGFNYTGTANIEAKFKFNPN